MQKGYSKIVNFIKSRIKTFYIFKLFSSVLFQVSSLFLVFRLTPSEFGRYSLIFTVAQLMFVLSSGWNSGGLLYFGTKYFVKTGSYFNIVIYRTIIIVISVIVVSLFFLLFNFEIGYFIRDFENIWLVPVLFMGLVLFDFVSLLLYPGNKDFIQSLVELIFTLVLFIAVLNYVNSINSYVYIYIGLSIIYFLIIVLIFLNNFLNKNIKINTTEFFEYLNYSKWQALSVASIYVINLGSNFIFVRSNIGIAEIGVYNFSYKLFSGFSPFFGIFGILIPKWIHSIDSLAIKNILKKRLFEIMLFLTILYLLALIFLLPFLKIIDKMQYKASATYFLLLFPAFIFMGLGNLFNTILMNTKLYKRAQFAIVIQGIFLLILSSIFIFKFQLGLYGAVLASTLAFMIGFIYSYSLFRFSLKPHHF